MAALSLSGSIPAHRSQVQAPGEGQKAGTGLAGFSAQSVSASDFPALLEGLAVAPGDTEGEGATPSGSGLPAGERRLPGKNAGAAFSALDGLIARMRMALHQAPSEGEAPEAASPPVQVPGGKQAAVGGVRQAAHAPLSLVSPLPRRRGTAAEDQAAGLPPMTATEQRVEEVRGRLASELAAESDVTGDAAPNPSIGAPVSESPVEAPTIGLETLGAASLLASNVAATAARGGLRVTVPVPNSLASRGVPRPVLETSSRRSSKTAVEQVLPLGPPEQETTGLAHAETRQAQDLPLAAGLNDRSELPEAGGARPAIPLLDTANDSRSTAGENVTATDAQVRVMALGTQDRGEVAFGVQVQTMATRPASPVETARIDSPAKMAVPQELEGTRPWAAPQVAPAEIGKPAAGFADGDAGGAGHERKQGAGERQHRSAQAPDSPAEGTPDIPGGTHWAPSAALRHEAPPEQIAAPDAKPARLEEGVKAEPKPEIQGAPAREIKLQVTGAEGRVELRISDRGGEVRVAVRTPDHQLAGTLRDNLPELATRLAETGLRSEIWHPAESSASNGRHTAEMPAGNFAQDADSQSRGHGNAQGDAQAQQQKNFQEQQQTHKEKRKDFAWLMSSLR